MEPKNAPERRKAFANFLLMFCLCILLVMITGFFSVNVPFKQNEQLRAESNKIKKERDFTNRFTTKLMAITDSVENILTAPKGEAGIRDSRIENDIKELFRMADTSLADTRYNQYMVTSLNHLFGVYKNIRDKTKKEGEDSDCMTQLDRLNTKGVNIYREYESLCRHANMSPLPNPFQ